MIHFNKLFSDHAQNHFIPPFSGRVNHFSQGRRIFVLVGAILTFVGLLAYGVYLWQNRKVAIQESDDQENTLQKIFQEKIPVVNVLKEEKTDEADNLQKESCFIEDSPKNELLIFDKPEEDCPQEIKKPLEFVDDEEEEEEEVVFGLPSTLSPLSTPFPSPRKAMAIPPIPSVDYEKMFEGIEKQTSKVEMLQFTKVNDRFPMICCPKATFVETPGNTDQLYLPANHVRLEGTHFILTQYPLSKHLSLFWRSSEKSCLIVDLTNHQDMQKGLASYVPNIGESWEDESLKIRCINKKPIQGLNADLSTYHIDLIPSEAPGSEWHGFDVTRIHYQGWTDFAGICEDDLDAMIALFEYYQKDSNRPIITHCRAGVGRSGTICVAYALHVLIKEGKVDASNLITHISRLILEGRLQRGPGFVQTPEQLQAICKWGWKALHQV